MDKLALSHFIKQKAKDYGFALCGFAKSEVLDKEKIYLSKWLSEKKNAGMEWMNNSFEKRVNPFLIFPEAKSIISLAYVYDTPFEHSEDKNIAKISRYAWGEKDYHKVIKKKLKPLCAEIESLLPEIKTRAYVDDGPMMDKVWAIKSGIGQQGKHTNIINPEIGSFFFLCEILINVELEYDKPIEADLCKSCMLCMNACPTGAIYDEYKVDANLCISYQTIENHGEIPPEINLDNWIYGCDTCQDVCPYNSKNIFTEDKRFYPREQIFNKSIDELSKLSEEEFNKLFEGTPVRRTKYSGWVRNLNEIGKRNL
ncbi:MAG: tRNA epoxyqueuosine(34) reductase QueG [Ignavibacteria bacterium]|nr:tRNA epoxyqueuosine(34) reductase QueG [Ignavibacteria bacterium]